VAETEVARPDAQEQRPASGGAVRGSVEAPRRHGRFDLRWPPRRLRGGADGPASSLTGLEDVPEGLDWDAFSTHYFARRRRHDLVAVSAYAAYTHGRVCRTSKARNVPRRSIALNETLRPQASRHAALAGAGRLARIAREAASRGAAPREGVPWQRHPPAGSLQHGRPSGR
jgi:hypothetical protein